MVSSWTEITAMLKDIDDDLLYRFSDDKIEGAHFHHEDNKSYQERFRKNMTQLHEEFKSRGNLFIEGGEKPKKISSKCVMASASSASVRNALSIGLKTYDTFCEERSVSRKHSI